MSCEVLFRCCVLRSRRVWQCPSRLVMWLFSVREACSSVSVMLVTSSVAFRQRSVCCGSRPEFSSMSSYSTVRCVREARASVSAMFVTSNGVRRICSRPEFSSMSSYSTVRKRCIEATECLVVVIALSLASSMPSFSTVRCVCEACSSVSVMLSRVAL